MVTLSSCLIWQIISFILPPNVYICVYAWTTLGSGPTIDLQKMPILAKKIIFLVEAYFDLGGYVNKQNCRIWGIENPHTHTLKSRRCQNVLLFGVDFDPEEKWARRGRYSQWRSLSGHVEQIFVPKNWKRILATFGFNRTVLCATQPKLHSMFWALFLKIALSAAELMLIGHLWAAIWHRWTIICGEPSKISVTPASQRQLTIMCLKIEAIV